MEWLDTAQQVIVLITGIVSLCGGGVSLFFLIKNLIKTMKNNTAAENWKLIMKIADSAMTAAEKSGLSGADKKAQVIEAVKAGCKEAGIDADTFMDQVSAYIDQCIDFANSLNK